MPQNHPIDPTYLRYVYDGLAQGRISADNASDLPHGLVGLYEELYPPSMPTAQRQQLLERFCTWALLCREVTTTLVAGLWQQTEEEVMDFIRTHSRWFASPKQGHYRLYHDKLRTYFLQRLAPNDVSRLNQHIITHLQQALQQQDGKDTEHYALQYLADHLYAEAMQYPEHGKQLLSLAHNTAIWQRQLNQSKGYTWTKEMLEHARHWAAQHSEEDLEECTLQQIDLHYMEQNSAPQIVELVAQNDMEAALARIQSFGGNDQEGLKRRFLLYMLCLMEVTLLDSKDQPWARSAAEKLLRHFDDNLPTDHSILNWNDFFPSYLVFQMACRVSEHELDYRPIYQRTVNWESDWIAEQGPYTQLQFDVLLACASGISDDQQKIKALSSISAELAKQGKVELAETAIQEALACARGISNGVFKNHALCDISIAWAKQGKFGEALDCARGITRDAIKDRALRGISIELIELGEVEEALDCARGINRKVEKILALSVISTGLFKQGKTEEAASLIQECLLLSRGDYFRPVSIELARQGKIDEALTCAGRMNNNRGQKSKALIRISTELAKQGKLEEAQISMQNALECVSGISHAWNKSVVLESISTELAKQGKVEEAETAMQEALSCASGISNNREKTEALSFISIELAKQGRIEAVQTAMQNALECASGIIDDSQKRVVLESISTELAKQGRMEEALSCANGIGDDEQKSYALSSISTKLFKQGKVEEAETAIQEALACARGISNGVFKNYALCDISRAWAKQGKFGEALACAYEISDEWGGKNRAFRFISTELAKQGKVEEALDCARGINREMEKILALSVISTGLFKQGKTEEAASLIQECLLLSRGDYFRPVFIELARQGKIDEALTCAGRMNNNRGQKSKALIRISTELAKQGKLEEAQISMQNALECVSGISNAWKSGALLSISTELAKQGKWQLAEATAKEITQQATRQEYWQQIGKDAYASKGYQEALQTMPHFNSAEAQEYILQGITQALQVDAITKEVAHLALKLPGQKVLSMEHVMQIHAFKQLFFEEVPPAKLQRYNRTLNLQWAMDIKAQMEN